MAMAASVASLFGAQPARISVKFADAETRAVVAPKGPDGKEGEQQYLFAAADNVCGTAEIAVNGAESNPIVLGLGVAATLGAISFAGNIATNALKDLDVDLGDD